MDVRRSASVYVDVHVLVFASQYELIWGTLELRSQEIGFLICGLSCSIATCGENPNNSK